MIWALQVLLDGIDITADLIGTVIVEEAESTSALADFEFLPTTQDDFRGKTAKVYIDVGGGLVIVHTGVVIRSERNVRTGIYRLRSSDRLQEHFRAMADDAAVLAALPGSVHSTAVFGETEDRWKFAQDALSTIASECHLDRSSVLAVVAWAAKGTADHVLDGDAIHNLNVNRFEERAVDDQVNRVIFAYGYGFTRWMSRLHSYSYSFSHNNPAGHTTWCDWYTASGQDGFDLPLVDTIRSAMNGAGWAMRSESYDGNPAYAACAGGLELYDINDAHSLDTLIVTSATLELFKNFTRPVGEDYTLTVESSGSITRYGSVTRERSAGRDTEADNSTFTDDTGYQADWTADSNGDRFQDQDDAAVLANDIQCALQSAQVQILERHRNVLVVVSDINPLITLADTVEVSGVAFAGGTLSARGKVSGLRYTLDRNVPRMEISIAISRGGGGTSDPLSPPARPDTSPAHTAPAASTVLNNHIGYRLDSPNYSNGGDQWSGWLVNSRGIFIPPDVPTPDQIYPNEFRIPTPGVEAEAVNERVGTQTGTYNVAVPDDLFTIS